MGKEPPKFESRLKCSRCYYMHNVRNFCQGQKIQDGDDHKIFEDRLIHAVERLSDRLDALISDHESRCGNFTARPKG